MAIKITLNVNGKSQLRDIKPSWSLAHVLRNELQLTGTKVGCNMGACGACTVILEKTKNKVTTKKAILSCLMLAVDAQTTTSLPQKIWTIEGLSSGNYLDPVQEHFMSNEAFQCGFCTPGFIMASKALVEKNKGKKGFPSKAEVRKALAGHICTCGNLKKVIDTMSGKYYSWMTNWPPNPFGKPGPGTWVRMEPRCKTVTASDIEELSVIDRRYQADQQAKLIVKGELMFGADSKLPAIKYYARLLLSTKAKAKITGITESAAMTIKGVQAVMTYNECPIWGIPSTGSDAGLVSFWGQEIAAVVADDPDTAACAVNALAKTVTYDTTSTLNLKPDLNPDLLINDHETNPAKTMPQIEDLTPILRGNVTTGKNNSDSVYIHDLEWTNYFQHGSLEPCSCIVWWENLGTTTPCLRIHSCTQAPHKAKQLLLLFKDYYFQTMYKKTTGKTLTTLKIQFATHGTGTAHGDKFPSEWCVTAALLSLKLMGMPVELSLSRRENFLTRTHQFEAKAKIEVGVKEKTADKGKIKLLNAKYWGSGGRNPVDFLEKGLPIKEIPWALQATYKCDNAQFKTTKVWTNKPKCGWWRCVADSPGTYLADIAMEMTAQKLYKKLKLTPYDFKLLNMSKDLTHQDDSSVVFSSNGLEDCFNECAKAIGIKKFTTDWHEPYNSNKQGNQRHGVGIAAHIDSHGGLAAQYSGMSSIVKAMVELTNKGKVELKVGISRASGGTNTTFCHIVAEKLGMKYEDVGTVIWGDTDTTLDGGIQAGSTRTITLGSAYEQAASAVRTKLLEEAAKQMGISPSNINNLIIEDNWIYESGNTSNCKTIKEVMFKYGSSIIKEGKTWDKKLRRTINSYTAGKDCDTRGVSASAVELLVDESTGEIEILKFANAVDCGRAIFYEGAKKQIDSGIELQLGQGLFYEQILDKDGATLNPNFVDSKWPTTLDIDPDSHIPIMVETYDGCGPYGAKGMGEPCVSNYVCITNAVYNAIGKWIYPPFHPLKILKALPHI